jgi:hypothetical protein
MPALALLTLLRVIIHNIVGTQLNNLLQAHHNQIRPLPNKPDGPFYLAHIILRIHGIDIPRQN